MAANKTFLGSVHRNCPEQIELPAQATGLLPGMLALNIANKLQAHNVADAGGFVYVVKELTAGGSVDDAYTVNDTAQAYIPHSGELYQMLVATGQALSVDTPLTSNGAGLLTIASGTDVIVCYSDESVTTTATTKVRVKFK
ncbi:MAG: hypothetical protein A2002_01395 [Pseudomonadales bacterium GWC1_66_9]|nr:MAG: hypothetical protein A2002_01395 [Pseudomonadales bacterium GWC1_66_9]